MLSLGFLREYYGLILFDKAKTITQKVVVKMKYYEYYGNNDN